MIVPTDSGGAPIESGIPRAQWPHHAESLAEIARPGDAGLGSTCKRILDDANDVAALNAVREFLQAEYGLSAVVRGGARWLLKIITGDTEADCTTCRMRQSESDAKYPLKQNGD